MAVIHRTGERRTFPDLPTFAAWAMGAHVGPITFAPLEAVPDPEPTTTRNHR